MLAILVRFFRMVFLLLARAPRSPFSRFGQIFITKKYLEKFGDYFCFEYVAWIHKQLNLRLGNIKGLQFTTRIILIRVCDALSYVLSVCMCVSLSLSSHIRLYTGYKHRPLIRILEGRLG